MACNNSIKNEITRDRGADYDGKGKRKGKRNSLIGDKFPEMEVQITHGMMKLTDDFSGKWFVLFSDPADFTPVCTTEFFAFAMR